MAVDADSILWAYRLFLDREPDNQNYPDMAQNFVDRKALRNWIMTSTEYLLVNGDARKFQDVEVLAQLEPYGVSGRMFVNLSDSIGLGVALGTYEREEIDFMKTHLRPGQTFVDLGGNIGLFSIVASSLVGPTGKVYTFEALSNNVATLKRSMAENAFCDNVVLTHSIVGDRARDDMVIAYQPLDEGSGNSGGSFIAPADASLPHYLRREPIHQDALDVLLGAETKVDFIKMDIEGAEVLAMRGAREILTHSSPIIMSEVHTRQLELVSQANWREYFALMASYGYRPHFITGGPAGAPVDEIEDGKIYNVAFLKSR